jgi:hypothetical protein
MGVFLRAPSHRRYLQLAFVASFAPAGAFIYQTVIFAQKMRIATPENYDLYSRKVSGGVWVSLLFLGVTVLLVYLLRTRRLKSLRCYDGAGALGGAAMGAVSGGSLAYLTWLLFRWLGFSKDIGWFVKAIYAVSVDYFVAGGALLGALLYGYLGHRRAQSRPSPGPWAGGATGAATGSALGYGAWWLCVWLGHTKGIEWFAVVVRDSRMEYFIAGGALLLAGLAIYRAVRGGGGGSSYGAPRSRPVQRTPAPSAGTPSAGIARAATRPAAPGTRGTRGTSGTRGTRGTRGTSGVGTRSAGLSAPAAPTPGTSGTSGTSGTGGPGTPGTSTSLFGD